MVVMINPMFKSTVRVLRTTTEQLFKLPLELKKTILVIGQGSRVLKMSISYLEMLAVMST